jgi:hypothetical protein
MEPILGEMVKLNENYQALAIWQVDKNYECI